MICRKQLSTGEELYVLEDNKFICKDDYISGKNGQGTCVSVVLSIIFICTCYFNAKQIKIEKIKTKNR